MLSPITGRVIGAKEVRVGNDKVGLNKLLVQVVSGLQLNISPDTTTENGYIAETSVSRKLTAQYQVYKKIIKLFLTVYILRYLKINTLLRFNKL